MIHKQFKLLPFILCLIFITPCQAKILLFTYAFNQPEFIILQDKTFKKFLHDEYEFVVFNDATDPEIFKEITQTCKNLGIRCIPIPQKIHARPYLNRSVGREWWVCEYQPPSVRNSNVVQYSLDTLGFEHDDIIVLFESDIFLTQEFSFRSYVEHYDVAGFDRSIECAKLTEKNVHFLWVGLLLLNLKTMPRPKSFNLNCGYVSNIVIDAGGFTNYYLNNNDQLSVLFMDKLYTEQFICKACEEQKAYRCTHNTAELTQAGFNTRTIQLIQEVPIDWGSGFVGTHLKRRRNIEFYMDKVFVHFYGGTGYAKYSYLGDDRIEQFYKDKAKAFFDYIDDITR